MDTDDNPQIALTWIPEGERRRERPRETGGEQPANKKEIWGDRDSWHQSEHRAKDRAGWRADVTALCALRHELTE